MTTVQISSAAMATNAKVGAVSGSAVTGTIIANARKRASATKTSQIRSRSVIGRKSVKGCAVTMIADGTNLSNAIGSRQIRDRSATGRRNARVSAMTIIADIAAGNGIMAAGATTGTGIMMTMIAATAGIMARITNGNRLGEMTTAIIGEGIATVIATIITPAVIILLIGGTAIAGSV